MSSNLIFINFHGFMGDADNKNCRALNNIFPQATVLSPQLDYLKESPNALILKHSSCVTEQQAKGMTVIPVGQSLGGWLAEQLSRRLDLPCLLTNPCLDPHLCEVITSSPMPKSFLEEYDALSTSLPNSNAFTLCTKTDEVLGEENFQRCALLGGWLKEVHGRHSGIENLTDELSCGINAILATPKKI